MTEPTLKSLNQLAERIEEKEKELRRILHRSAMIRAMKKLKREEE